ncbi:MAG: FAD-binding oxidoreductase [SAR202 cluster bacterium]|nr:FAD-binding oxidoreductase [SAR202 cluster bacterium]
MPSPPRGEGVRRRRTGEGEGPDAKKRNVMTVSLWREESSPPDKLSHDIVGVGFAGFAASCGSSETLGCTPDFLPIVGRLPNEPEVYFTVGFSGHGHSLGLISGDRAINLMLHGTEPGILGVIRQALG